MTGQPLLPTNAKALYIQESNQSHKFLGGLLAAAVVGLVVYAGASSSSTSLYTAPAVQTTTSARAVSMGVPVQPRVHVQHAAAQVYDAPEMHEQEVEYVYSVEAPQSQNGFAMPAMLASLSVAFLGLARWVLNTPSTAMAFTSGTKSSDASSLQATSHGWAIKEDTMLTPLGYYEAYELVVVVSPKLSDLEKEEELSSLEALFVQNQCKKVEKLDRGRRLLAYPIKGHIEAYVILYTFKGPKTMPQSIVDWFTAPGANAQGHILRCNTRKQRRVRKGKENAVGLGEDMAMWNI